MVDIDAEVDDRDFDASEVSTWVGQTKGNTGAFDLCVRLAAFMSNCPSHRLHNVGAKRHP